MSESERAGRKPLPAADDRGEEDGPSFRVIDRRRFGPDGSERPEEDEAGASRATGGEPPSSSPSRAQQEAAKPADRDAQRPSHAGEFRPGAGAPGADPDLAMPQGAPYEEREDGALEPTFGTLLISLSTQALMHLGEIPDLEGGETRRDLAAARNIIDLIAVLERKTRGNLDADEAALLERILYDLRMRFVALSRG